MSCWLNVELPCDAVIVAKVVPPTGLVVTVKEAEVALAAIVTEEGTVAAALLLASVTL